MQQETPDSSRWSEESIHESLGHFDWSNLETYNRPSPEELRDKLDFFKAVGDETLLKSPDERENFLRKKITAGIDTFADKIASPAGPVNLARRKGRFNTPISKKTVSATNRFNRSAPIKMALALELASRVPPPLGRRSEIDYRFGSKERGENWGRAVSPMIVTPKEPETRELMIRIFAKEAARLITRVQPSDRGKFLDGICGGFKEEMDHRLFVEEKNSSDDAGVITTQLTSQFLEALLIEVAGFSAEAKEGGAQSDTDTAIGPRKDTVWHKIRGALGRKEDKAA